MLQTGKSIFNQMPDFIKVPVHVFVLLLAVALARDVRLAASLLNLRAQFVRIVAFVRADNFRFRQIYRCYQFWRNTVVS